MDDSTCSSFNIERVDDTQDSIDPSLISESCSSFYERGDQGYICKVCEHHYASRRYVLFHLTNSHNIPTHSWPTCNICGKIFTKPSKLAVHILSHPKNKSVQDFDTTETTFVSSTPPIAAPVIKVFKQSTPDRSRNKVKIVAPKLLTVYFTRSSLPNSYKQNPYKCGKCFKSFLTANSREIHRDLIHKTVIGSGFNNSFNSKAKSKRKKSNRKLINLNFPSKLKNYKHKHSSQSTSKSPHKSPLSKKLSLSHIATPQEDGGKKRGSQSKLDFSSHIESLFPSKSPVMRRKSSSPRLVESVPKASKRTSSYAQELEFNGTPKKIRSEERLPSSLPLAVPFGFDIVMDDLPSDL